MFSRKLSPDKDMLVSCVEKIAREHGPVAVAYIPQNDPHRWTVYMVEPRGVWHDHEHGTTLEETTKALYDQLRKDKDAR